MDSGVMAECGPPDMLLSNQDGIFRSLWDKHQKNHATVHTTEEEEKEENENENEKEETYYALL